jgi:cbb3-type cytochrome oxidase maturation protein
MNILLALVFLAAFVWAQKSGQHDDLHTPAMRILLDEEAEKEEQI